MRRWLSIWVVSLSLLFASCANTHKNLVVTNLPPGVTQVQVQKYYTAVGVAKTVADQVDNVTNVVIQLNRQGVFPDGEAYATTLRSLGNIAKAGKDADKQLALIPDYFGQAHKDVIYKFITTVADQLSTIEVQLALGIKSDQARLSLMTALNTVRLSLQIAQGLTQ